MITLEPFEGDGRVRVNGPTPSPNTRVLGQPTSVTRGEARRIIKHLVTTGTSQHSAWGSTLWVIVAWNACNPHVELDITTHFVDAEVVGYTVTIKKK